MGITGRGAAWATGRSLPRRAVDGRMKDESLGPLRAIVTATVILFPSFLPDAFLWKNQGSTEHKEAQHHNPNATQGVHIMVREVRMSWDDPEIGEVPPFPEMFDEADDPVLDAYLPRRRLKTRHQADGHAARQATNDKPAARPQRRNNRRRATGARRRRSAGSPHGESGRHLAGADWLSNPPQKESEQT